MHSFGMEVVEEMIIVMKQKMNARGLVLYAFTEQVILFWFLFFVFLINIITYN